MSWGEVGVGVGVAGGGKEWAKESINDDEYSARGHEKVTKEASLFLSFQIWRVWLPFRREGAKMREEKKTFPLSSPFSGGTIAGLRPEDEARRRRSACASVIAAAIGCEALTLELGSGLGSRETEGRDG